MRTARLLVPGLLVLASCRTGSPPPADGPRPTVGMPMEGMHEIMQAKLMHSRTLLEAIAMEDLAAVEQNAEALTLISEQSDFRVHTTEAYAVFSRQFRDITNDMAGHARAGDLDAVSLDYVQMTHACLNCHAYLRREGLLRDMPGAES